MQHSMNHQSEYVMSRGHCRTLQRPPTRVPFVQSHKIGNGSQKRDLDSNL